MAKLRQLAPRMGALARRSVPGRAAPMRDRVDTWRKWYKTARWQRLRWQVLEAEGFTCRRCGKLSLDGKGSDLVADHIKPHRGDLALFWDRDNLQCLCATCHSRDKQREERAADAAS